MPGIRIAVSTASVAPDKAFNDDASSSEITILLGSVEEPHSAQRKDAWHFGRAE